jgi:hypothetical protein
MAAVFTGSASAVLSGGTVNGLYGVFGASVGRNIAGKVNLTVSDGVVLAETVAGLDGSLTEAAGSFVLSVT